MINFIKEALLNCTTELNPFLLLFIPMLHQQSRLRDEVGRLLGLSSVAVYFILFYFILHFTIPLGKFGPPYLGKATAAERAAPHTPSSAC